MCQHAEIDRKDRARKDAEKAKKVNGCSGDSKKNDGHSNVKKEEIDVYDYSQMVARELRKWCLERAFEKRDRTGVGHMAVTNVAEEYYLWITQGQSQGNSLDPTLKTAKKTITASGNASSAIKPAGRQRSREWIGKNGWRSWMFWRQ